VWIFFAHELEDEVRCSSLEKLMPIAREYGGQKMGRDGMVFFPWDQLTRVAILSAIMAFVEQHQTKLTI
jgi:hypothetical protein